MNLGKNHYGHHARNWFDIKLRTAAVWSRWRLNCADAAVDKLIFTTFRLGEV